MYLYLLLALYSWQNMILHPRMNSAACRWIPAEASKTNLWQSTLWTLLAELPEGAVQANCVGTKPTWTCFFLHFVFTRFQTKMVPIFWISSNKTILEFICYWLPADLNHSFERPLKQFSKKSTPVLSSKPSSDFEILSPCDALHPICLFVRTAKNFFKKGLSQSLCFQFYQHVFLVQVLLHVFHNQNFSLQLFFVQTCLWFWGFGFHCGLDRMFKCIS